MQTLTATGATNARHTSSMERHILSKPMQKQANNLIGADNYVDLFR
jgi:hypothetical protein